MATENEVKTSAERFLARVKDFTWLGMALAATVTAIWAATTYLNDKRLEYVKTFNEKQIELSFDTAKTVANLLTAETKEAWDKNAAEFRNLYWGPLVLVESQKLEEAMVALCKALPSDFSQRDKVWKEVFEVSKALREQIRDRNEHDWRIDLASLTNETTRPAPEVHPKASGC